MTNLECYVDKINIKDIPTNTFCKIHVDSYGSKYILDYGQDLKEYTRPELIAPGEIRLLDHKKEIQKALPSLISYLNFFTSKGFELIHYDTDYILLKKI